MPIDFKIGHLRGGVPHLLVNRRNVVENVIPTTTETSITVTLGSIST